MVEVVGLLDCGIVLPYEGCWIGKMALSVHPGMGKSFPDEFLMPYYTISEKMDLSRNSTKQDTFDTLAEAYFLVKLSQKTSEMRGEKDRMNDWGPPDMNAKIILFKAIKVRYKDWGYDSRE